VSVVPSFARLWLLPRIALLEGAPPDLRIEVDVEHRVSTLSDARVAIRHGRGGWPGVASVPLFEEELVPVANAEIAARLGADADAAALLHWPLLVDLPDTNWRLWFAASGLEYERRPQDRSFLDYDLTLAAAAEGLGVALLRDPFGAEACRGYGLRPVSSLRVPSPTCFHVVTRLGQRRSAIARLVERLAAATDGGGRP
jgi:DNA-binding transcriptional LysR family regulator